MPIVHRPMGLPITAGCDTAWNRTRVCSDASSTEMQCCATRERCHTPDNLSWTLWYRNLSSCYGIYEIMSSIILVLGFSSLVIWTNKDWAKAVIKLGAGISGLCVINTAEIIRRWVGALPESFQAARVKTSLTGNLHL